jgi:cysteinyl-tRNA synthetase
MDLQFPHHENEIAQSEGATGEKFVNLWMHNGFVRVNEEKMSKSLGNFFTVREVLKQYKPEIIRFFILSSHYRSPLNYSDEQLNDAKAALTRLYTALRGVKTVADVVVEDVCKTRFEQAMDDDFNTPVAIAELFHLASELNIAKKNNTEKAGQLAASLKTLGGLLGILQADPDEWLKGKINSVSVSSKIGVSGKVVSSKVSDSAIKGDAWIEQQIQERLEAKKSKNWALADKIRNELKQQGVILEDAPNGTTSWRRE